MLSQRQLFQAHIAPTSDNPIMLEIIRAKGCYLQDINKKWYLDLIGGISVNNIGHQHKAIKRAIRRQSSKFLHLMVYGEFIQKNQTRLAQYLSEKLPQALNSVYFVNSGSEAIEGAMKLAKKHTNRTQIISMKNAYHGSTHGALSLMDNKYFSNKFSPLLPDIDFVEFNEVNDLKKITSKTAAVIIEPIQGEAGYLQANPIFLHRLKKVCTENGALLIFDEIQSGMGRTGKLFAFEGYNVEPDVLCLSKAFGGGLPLGAFISNKKVMFSLAKNPILGHITTFGGNALACATSLAMFKTLEKEKLVEQVAEKEMLFKDLLKHSLIQHVTGKGLMLKVKLKNEKITQYLIDYCLKHGVFTDWFLYDLSACRISPPLTISTRQIRMACRTILEGLDKISKKKN